MLTLGICMIPRPGDDSEGLNPAKESSSDLLPALASPASPSERVPASPSERPSASRSERALAGLQAGTCASLVSLGWWMLAGLPNNQSIWTLPNLMGGIFYGQRSLRASVGPFTFAGLSIHLLLCVALALLISQLLAPTLRLRTAILTATLSASLWFYLWDGFFWRLAFPPYALYSKQATIFFGFLLQGLCVGLYSLFVRSHRAANIST